MSGSDGFDPLASLFDAPPPRPRKKASEPAEPPDNEFDAPPPPSFRTEFTDPRISDVDLDADDFGQGDPVTDDNLRDRITQEVEREAEAAEGSPLAPVPDEVLDAPVRPLAEEALFAHPGAAHVAEAMDPPPMGEPSISELPTQEATEDATARLREQAEAEQQARQAQAAQLAKQLAEEAKAKAAEKARAQAESRRLAEAAALARQLAEQAKAQAVAEAQQPSRSRSLMARGRRPTSAREALARAAESEQAATVQTSPTAAAEQIFADTLPGGKVLMWVEARDRPRLRELWTKHLNRGQQRSDVALIVAAQQVLRALDEVPPGKLWMGDAVVKRLSWALFVDTASGRMVAGLSPAASYLSEG